MKPVLLDEWTASRVQAPERTIKKLFISKLVLAKEFRWVATNCVCWIVVSGVWGALRDDPEQTLS